MKILYILWTTLIILTGTYFRSKTGTDIETKEMDWLIYAQLAFGLLGSLAGLLVILKEKKFGTGSYLLLAFLFISGFSVLFTPLYSKSIGYWILLLATSLLTMALIQRSKDIKDLERIEWIWLITIVLIIIKDSLISLLIPGLANDWQGGRLAMGVTHANRIGLMAALSFWLSFKLNKIGIPLFNWVLRIVLIIVVVLSKSRMSMLCLLVGGMVYLYLIFSQNKEQGINLKLMVFGLFSSLLLFFSLAFILEMPFVVNLFEGFNRGQSMVELVSITGRTDIWPLVLNKIFDNPVNTIFGHGFGVSSFILNDDVLTPAWYVYHAHNDFLEIFLSTGIFGFLCIIAFILYGCLYIFNHKKCIQSFSLPFILRATTVFSMVVLYSITECNLGQKVTPIVFIFIFYILALDMRKYLTGQN
jgi:O-antigen ligase